MRESIVVTVWMPACASMTDRNRMRISSVPVLFIATLRRRNEFKFKILPVHLRQCILPGVFPGGDELERTRRGTGLGLYIVRTLVHLLKGKVSVSDRDGQRGSRDHPREQREACPRVRRPPRAAGGTVRATAGCATPRPYGSPGKTWASMLSLAAPRGTPARHRGQWLFGRLIPASSARLILPASHPHGRDLLAARTTGGTAGAGASLLR